MAKVYARCHSFSDTLKKIKQLQFNAYQVEATIERSIEIIWIKYSINRRNGQCDVFFKIININ